MAAIVVLRALDETGDRILDELEAFTEIPGMDITGEGERTYHLNAAGVGTDGLDVALDKVNAGWRDHVVRVTP